MFDASFVKAYYFLRARYYRNLGVQSLIKILLDGQNKKLHDVL
jgi:hypothetical protein